MIQSIKSDIIIGTESWLDPSIKDNEYFPSKFKVHRKHCNLYCGDVIIVSCEEYVSSLVPELEENCDIIWANCDIIWAKVEMKGCKFLHMLIPPLSNEKKTMPKFH